MTHYAYASGIINAYEKRLLTKAKFHQLAESPTVEEFHRNLSDTSYGGLNSELFSDEYFYNTETELLKIASGLILEQNIKNIFLLQSDLLNLRVALKHAINKTALPEVGASAGGLTTYPVIKRCIENGNYFLLPRPLPDICEAVVKKNKIKTPLELDTIIDKYYFQWALHSAKNNPRCHEYIKLCIDVLNITCLVRYKTFFSQSPKLIDHLFVAGGNIDSQLFKRAASDSSDISEFFKKIVFFAYKDELKKIDFQSDYLKDISSFADDVKTKFWKKLKLQPFGFHIVCGYLHAKKTEMKNIRIIYNAIRNGIHPASIKNRLRETYI